MQITNELHVIFGTGPVGITLSEELLAKGKQVRLVNRSGKGQVPEGSELVAGDASKLATVQELTKGASVVYNCTHAAYENWPEILPRLQENMIEGAAYSNAKLVVIDGLYQYGETHGQIMTETMATQLHRARDACVQNWPGGIYKLIASAKCVLLSEGQPISSGHISSTHLLGNTPSRQPSLTSRS